VVVLQSVQPIGADLRAAFPVERFEARILTSGPIKNATRPWTTATVPVETVPHEGWEQRLREIAPAAAVELVTNDEFCLESCAALRRRLGLPPRLEMPLAPYRDKVAMKEALSTAGIAVPTFVPLEPVPSAGEAAAIARPLGPRIVVKPRRGANNRGVVEINSPRALERWLEDHAGESGWEAESFLEGTLFHADGLVLDGRVEPLLVGEYVRPPLALESGGAIGSITLPWDADAAREGRALNRRVVEALGGAGRFVIHTEFVRERSGRVVFLETAARAPGGLISEMSARHIGVHLEQLNLRVQAGEGAVVPALTGMHSGWLWFPRSGAGERRPPAPRCGHRLESLPTSSPIAYSLLAWDPDPQRLREEVRAVCPGVSAVRS
jgi:biotin carboxylase